MWIVGYYLEFCWNRMKSIKVSSIPTHSCIDSINRTRGSTSCGLSHNLTCIWQMWIHIYMYQSNLQATHVNLILVQNHAPSVPFGLLRFPNCLECPVASVLGNLTITQIASAGGADESSSKKVKATMRMLLRREVRRHTLISVGQRGRGRHLLSEGLSPKVGG